MPFCRECGKSVEADWKVCPHCAAPIGNPVSANIENSTINDSVVLVDNSQIINDINSISTAVKSVSQCLNCNSLSPTQYACKLCEKLVCCSVCVKDFNESNRIFIESTPNYVYSKKLEKNKLIFERFRQKPICKSCIEEVLRPITLDCIECNQKFYTTSKTYHLVCTFCNEDMICSSFCFRDHACIEIIKKREFYESKIKYQFKYNLPRSVETNPKPVPEPPNPDFLRVAMEVIDFLRNHVPEGDTLHRDMIPKEIIDGRHLGYIAKTRILQFAGLKYFEDKIRLPKLIIQLSNILQNQFEPEIILNAHSGETRAEHPFEFCDQLLKQLPEEVKKYQLLETLLHNLIPFNGKNLYEKSKNMYFHYSEYYIKDEEIGSNPGMHMKSIKLSKYFSE